MPEAFLTLLMLLCALLLVWGGVEGVRWLGERRRMRIEAEDWAGEYMGAQRW